MGLSDNLIRHPKILQLNINQETAMLKRIFIYLIPVWFLITNACTHEDTSDCVQGVRLHFTHLLNNQNVNLFGDKVEAVSVFVFDSNDKYVETYQSQSVKLTNDYVMTLPLKPGLYNFIVLGGNLTNYHVGEMFDSSKDHFEPALKKGVTDIKHFSFLIKNEYQSQGEMEVNPDLEHLYYGNLDSLSIPYGSYTDATVDLLRDTKKINVHIIGYQYLLQTLTRSDLSKQVDVHATSLNGRYKKDNSADEFAKPLKYLFGNHALSNDTLKCNTVMMRLFAENDPSRLKILIPSTQYVLYDRNMIEQILKNPKYQSQRDLDREDEFTFEITITPGLNVTIKINGWEIIEITPDKSNNSI